MAEVAGVVIVHNEAELLPLTLPPLVATCRELIVLDMDSTDGTADVCRGLLRSGDRLLPYHRRFLFQFGFAHARNYAARHARSPWIFAVDADEYLEQHELAPALAALQAEHRVYSVSRRNYAPADVDPILDLSRLAEAPFSVETQKRIYRNDPRLRFEGMVHEELWDADRRAAGPEALPLTMHHLSAYKRAAVVDSKIELYSFLLMKALLDPGFRRGTDDWYFSEYLPVHLHTLHQHANTFADRHDLPGYDWPQVYEAASRPAA